MNVLKMNSRFINIIAHCRSLPVRQISTSSYLYTSSKETDPTIYDVVISGGGMVGTAMAASLGHDPAFGDKKILLLEAGPHKTIEKLSEHYSSRVCALSLATKKLLTKFGAWKNIEAMRYQPVKHMQGVKGNELIKILTPKIWDSCSDSMISFNVPINMDSLAHIVENEVILSAIEKQLEPVKDIVHVKYGTKVQKYELSNGSTLPKVLLSDGQSIQTKLLIGADGIHSLLRKTANIFCVNWDYNQTAVVATIHVTEDSENNTAWQRFLSTGPIAFLPLSNKFSCLIWSTTPEHAEKLVHLSPEKFVDEVNGAFWSDSSINSFANIASHAVETIFSTIGFGERKVRQLPPTVLDFDLKSRMKFPLGLCHATHYVKPRMALIGDAAHRVHPLSGQGVNLGFGDVACLTEVLSQAILRGEDLGSLGHLTSFETKRQRQVVSMMAVIDGLNRLYSNSFPPAVLLRSIGCQAADSLGPIKEQMVRFAMN